jgi:hypothetical protein
LTEKAELQEALIKSEELRLGLAKTLIDTQVGGWVGVGGQGMGGWVQVQQCKICCAVLPGSMPMQRGSVLGHSWLCTAGAAQLEYNDQEVAWENEKHELLKRLAEAEAG